MEICWVANPYVYSDKESRGVVRTSMDLTVWVSHNNVWAVCHVSKKVPPWQALVNLVLSSQEVL